MWQVESISKLILFDALLMGSQEVRKKLLKFFKMTNADSYQEWSLFTSQFGKKSHRFIENFVWKEPMIPLLA